MQNGYVERFNRTYRQDVLDACLFEDIEQARLLSEEWMRDYNYGRPHESLEGKTPIQMEENSYELKHINNYFVNSNPV
jgi:putative transposase